MEDYSFLGRGWKFPPDLNMENQETNMVNDDENIRQSLGILLSTSPGERIHRYDYGCPIRKYIFEVMDATTQTLLREEIERAIILFEPRIDLNDIIFDFRQEEGILQIKLDYDIRTTNRRSNMVYPFYLNEGTDLTL